MYKLKVAVTRGSALLGVVGLLVGVGASAMPAFVSADALNPLTHRSLTLSSSSPGWAFTDGSGNSLYAPPNSGANGQKTGNTFSFNVSTDSTGGGTGNPIKTLSFQYCTTSAGSCTSPGNDTVHGTDTSSTSDLNVVTSSPAEVGSSDFGTVIDSTSGAVKAVPGVTNPLNPSDSTGQYAAHAVSGNFVVYWDNAGTWTLSSGWAMSATNDETGAVSPTGQNNYIILTKAAGLGLPSDAMVKVLFFGTTTNYITNPGAGAFFVKINTYTKEYNASPTGSQVDMTGLEPATDANVIDGGVTVANVMNQSIQITTKVLETMEFSVGTVDPDTLSSADGGANAKSTFEAAEGLGGTGDSNANKHGSCDSILTGMLPTDPQNVLRLGDQAAESSLETAHTFSTHSYWRLSSNSSAGATVYYSGHTLSNTENDQIAPINGGTGNEHTPNHGTAQFGLALDNGTSGPYSVSYGQEATYENAADNGFTSVDATTTSDNSANLSYHAPQLAPLVPGTNYKDGTGTIDSSPTTEFSFDVNSDTIPAAVATENSAVVDCVTAKPRYIANIAATTPAGIYTTKINWIAAPQY